MTDGNAPTPDQVLAAKKRDLARAIADGDGDAQQVLRAELAELRDGGAPETTAKAKGRRKK